MLLSQTESEGAAISRKVQGIYAKRGLLVTSEVGDEAAYDFVFMLMGQPRAFKPRFCGRWKSPESITISLQMR